MRLRSCRSWVAVHWARARSMKITCTHFWLDFCQLWHCLHFSQHFAGAKVFARIYQHCSVGCCTMSTYCWPVDATMRGMCVLCEGPHLTDGVHTIESLSSLSPHFSPSANNISVSISLHHPSYKVILFFLTKSWLLGQSCHDGTNTKQRCRLQFQI